MRGYPLVRFARSSFTFTTNNDTPSLIHQALCMFTLHTITIPICRLEIWLRPIFPETFTAMIRKRFVSYCILKWFISFYVMLRYVMLPRCGKSPEWLDTWLKYNKHCPIREYNKALFWLNIIKFDQNASKDVFSLWKGLYE